MPDFNQENLFELRRRVLSGAEIPDEEMAGLITYLRADREAKILSTPTRKKKSSGGNDLSNQQKEDLLSKLMD